MRTLTALTLKFITAFFILVVWGLATGAPTPGKAAFIALVVGVVSWLADLLFPFGLQGVTRWAIDGGLAALTIFFGQLLWPGPNLSLLHSLVIGFGLGALELPLHEFLAARYGVRRPDDNRDGIR